MDIPLFDPANETSFGREQRNRRKWKERWDKSLSFIKGLVTIIVVFMPIILFIAALIIIYNLYD